MRGFVVGLLLGAFGLSWAPVSVSAADCSFVFGFATLDSFIPSTVGACLENQYYAANGDAQQQTTGGLLVWRKADNWTAFTDGYHTWINGPQGVQERLNSQHFSWEAPVSTDPDPAISAACFTVATATMTDIGPKLPSIQEAQELNQQLNQLDPGSGTVVGVDKARLFDDLKSDCIQHLQADGGGAYSCVQWANQSMVNMWRSGQSLAFVPTIDYLYKGCRGQ